MRFLKNLGRNVRATAGWFLLGILLSALFQRYVPAEAFGSLFGEQGGFGLLLAATIGVPLYACGGGTIPLLQQWLGIRHESWGGGFLYDHRAGHENHKSGRPEDRLGSPAVCPLSGVCHTVFPGSRVPGESHLLTGSRKLPACPRMWRYSFLKTGF